MGQYTTVQGHVQYKDRKTYDKVVSALYHDDFLSEDKHNYIQSDWKEWFQADKAILNPRDLIIYIPWHCYYRFHKIQDILYGVGPGPYLGVKDINLVLTCTDGCSEGFYYDNNKLEWIYKDFSEIDKDVPDSDTNAEDYQEWENSCEEYFNQFLRETPEYVPNSVDFFTKEDSPCKPKRKSSPKKTQKISKRR